MAVGGSRGWIAPPAIPTETICRTLVIPADKFILAAVGGALDELTHWVNWQSIDGQVMPGVIAASMRLMVANWLVSECTPLAENIEFDIQACNLVWREITDPESPWIILGNVCGPAGPAGPAGADGVDGAPGPAGPAGPAGADGVDGVDGIDGAPGPAGPAGPAGADGVDGIDGADGVDGIDGREIELLLANCALSYRYAGDLAYTLLGSVRCNTNAEPDVLPNIPDFDEQNVCAGVTQVIDRMVAIQNQALDGMELINADSKTYAILGAEIAEEVGSWFTEHIPDIGEILSVYFEMVQNDIDARRAEVNSILNQDNWKEALYCRIVNAGNVLLTSDFVDWVNNDIAPTEATLFPNDIGRFSELLGLGVTIAGFRPWYNLYAADKENDCGILWPCLPAGTFIRNFYGGSGDMFSNGNVSIVTTSGTYDSQNDQAVGTHEESYSGRDIRAVDYTITFNPTVEFTQIVFNFVRTPTQGDPSTRILVEKNGNNIYQLTDSSSWNGQVVVPVTGAFASTIRFRITASEPENNDPPAVVYLNSLAFHGNGPDPWSA